MKEVFINPNASGKNDGTSPEDAYTSMEYAQTQEASNLQNVVFYCVGDVDPVEYKIFNWKG